MNDTFGSGTGAISMDDIRPLVFGAAWKVVDQLVELALEQKAVPHDRGSDYTIGRKVRAARNGEASPAGPFGARADVWIRVVRTYASTEELRNSLAHRRLVVDSSTCRIDGVPRPGGPAVHGLTVDEQLAFCHMAVGMAGAVIAGQLTNRWLDQLMWACDQLVAHHGEPLFGASPASGLIPRVVVRPPLTPANEVELDFVDLITRARAAVGGVSYYDLEIHVPDGRVLAGSLEDATPGPGAVSIDSPPPWLSWQ